MFSRPLPDILKDIPLSDQIRNTLLDPGDCTTTLSRLWSMILAHEAADWDRVSELLPSLGLGSERINSVYADAVIWADANFRR